MQVTGIVFVKINGQLLRSKDGAKLMMGGFERTAQKGYKVYGFSSAIMESTVECTISHTSDTDLDGLRDGQDLTVSFETDTGKTYAIANAFLMKPPELTGGDGDVELMWSGDPAKEL